jgi:type I restriction enzyme, S subunit
MNETELPNGWALTKLGDVIEVVRGASPRPKGDPRYFGGNIPWIMISDISREKGRFISRTRDTVTEEGAKKSRYLKSGTLILSNSGTVCVPKILAVDGCIHDGFVAFPNLPQGIDQLYIYYYLDYIRPYIIQENKQGVTQVNLNTNIVKSITIALPPYSEQCHISIEIEELFSRLDAGVEALRRARAQLQRYRQSVLKAAVEGRLTAEWREAHPEVEPNEAHKIEFILSSELPKLPNSWNWVSFSQLIKGSQNGISKRRSDDGNPVHVLRLADILNYKISSKNPRDIKLTEQELNKYLIQDGDLLCIRVNGSKNLVGRMIPFINDDEWTFCDHFIRFKLDKELVSPSYLSNYFNTKIARNYIEFNMVSSAGQNTISQKTLASLPVPLPSIKEQKAITDEIDRLFSISEVSANSLGECFGRLNLLRQSILKRAFEGKLVPQDPSDEPASLLLERIRAERTKASQPRGRRRSPKTNQVSLIQ